MGIGSSTRHASWMRCSASTITGRGTMALTSAASQVRIPRASMAAIATSIDVITKRDGAAFECELKWSIQGKLFRAAKGTGSAHNDRVEFVWHPVDITFGTGGKDSWEHSGRFVDADTIEGRWSRRGGGLTGAFK